MMDAYRTSWFNAIFIILAKKETVFFFFISTERKCYFLLIPLQTTQCDRVLIIMTFCYHFYYVNDSNKRLIIIINLCVSILMHLYQIHFLWLCQLLKHIETMQSEMINRRKKINYGRHSSFIFILETQLENYE